jgi:hypothetical protein
MEHGRVSGVGPMSHVTNVLVHVGTLDRVTRERITDRRLKRYCRPSPG